MDNSFVLSVYKFQIERGGESLLKSKNAKNHSFQKNQGGGVYFESGCAKNYAFQKFWGGGGVKGVLENSR